MKKMLPKISIVIPSFNQENYIRDTILSIVNQNYPNLELNVEIKSCREKEDLTSKKQYFSSSITNLEDF